MDNSEILIYQSEAGNTKVEAPMEGELQETATVKEYLTTQQT